MKNPRWTPPEPGESVVKQDYPPPPVYSAPSNGGALSAFIEWEKQAERRRAYRERKRERILETQRAYRARKRSERSRYWCLLKHTRPLTTKLSAVATAKPHF